MKLTSFLKIAAALTLVGAVAQADPITGTIQFGALSSSITSTQLIITNPAYVTLDSGSYAGIPLVVPGPSPIVTFATPITYAPPTVTTGPLWSFVYNGLTYSFTDLTLSVVGTPTSTFLNIDGTGNASITGPGSTFTTTSGTWSITDTSTNGVDFTFSASTSSVPDNGTTAMLTGLGVVGIAIGALARRKFAQV